MLSFDFLGWLLFTVYSIFGISTALDCPEPFFLCMTPAPIFRPPPSAAPSEPASTCSSSTSFSLDEDVYSASLFDGGGSMLYLGNYNGIMVRCDIPSNFSSCVARIQGGSCQFGPFDGHAAQTLQVDIRAIGHGSCHLHHGHFYKGYENGGINSHTAQPAMSLFSAQTIVQRESFSVRSRLSETPVYLNCSSPTELSVVMDRGHSFFFIDSNKCCVYIVDKRKRHTCFTGKL